MIKIAPSILSADFVSILSADLANLAAETADSMVCGADMVHFDVMDGTFVPAITFGAAMCKAVRPYTKLPLDVHVMVEHPETYIASFRDAGADYFTFHVEADRHSHRTLQKIRSGDRHEPCNARLHGRGSAFRVRSCFGNEREPRCRRTKIYSGCAPQN